MNAAHPHPHPRRSKLPLRGHAILALLAGSALGGAAAAFGAGDAPVGLAVACWAGVALLIAPFQYLGARAVLAGRLPQLAREGLAGAFASLRTLDRRPGLAAVAGFAVAATLLVAVALLAYALQARLSSVTEPGVAPMALAAAVVGALGCAAVAFWPLTGALAAALAAVDRAIRLPLPANAHPYVAVFGAAPVAVGALVVLRDARPHLGPLAAALDLVLFAAVEVALLPVAALAVRRVGRRALSTVVAVAAVAAGAAVLLAAPDPSRALAAAGHPGATAATLLRALSDVDRDGVAALLGGGDCDPFDAAVHPGAPDAPGDGRDTDCDGIDPAPRAPDVVVSNALPLEQIRAWDVVIVVIDAVRADHVSALGYERETTPFLDALAEQSLVFTDVCSPSSSTRVTMPSLLTGTWPARIPWKAGTTDLAEEAVTLPEQLRDAGYRTVGRVNRWVAGQLGGIAQGFDEYGPVLSLDEQRAMHADSAAILVHRLLPALAADDPDTPRFLYVYLEDPHAPYSVRHAPERSFGDAPIDRYDAALAYADRQLGVLLDDLRLSGRWERTVVVVTSDHGEEFEEHGGRRHARTLFEEVVRVPLVVRVPGLAPQRVDAPVSLVDVVPTVLELVGLPVDAAAVDGRSLLLPALAGSPSPDRSRLMELRGQPRVHHQRAVVEGSWKLVRDLAAGTDALYDLATDPGETADRAAAEPARVEHLRRVLADLAARR